MTKEMPDSNRRKAKKIAGINPAYVKGAAAA
jgi:hypothetical protein